MWRLLPLVMPALVACNFTKFGLDDVGPDAAPPPDADPNAPDADPNAPDAEPPADVDPGAPDACVTECIDGNTIFDCGTGGPRACPLGCTTSGGAHCRVMVPSNDPDPITHLSGATADVVVPYTFDTSIYAWSIFTDTGEIRDETGVPIRDPGTGLDNGIGYYQEGNIGIFTMNTLTVADDAQLWGFGERALLLLVQGDVDIHGVIDVSAGVCANGLDVNRACPGPGGGYGAGGAVSPTPGDLASGCAAGGNGNDGAGDKTGGGGGGLGLGMRGQGGDGGPGDSGAPEPGGVGGVPGLLCPDESLIPLMGGSGAGWGGGATGGRGGGGGGAVQITSYSSIDLVRITAGATVGIWAGGAGGGGGQNDEGGGGGGAGGAILLEAPVVMIDGFSWLAANGGSGGGGNAGMSGNLGNLSDVPAVGGTGGVQGATAGNGGDGAALAVDAGDGEFPGDHKGTGGGGGGIGIVRVNAAVHTGGTTTSSPTASFASPASL